MVGVVPDNRILLGEYVNLNMVGQSWISDYRWTLFIPLQLNWFNIPLDFETTFLKLKLVIFLESRMVKHLSFHN